MGMVCIHKSSCADLVRFQVRVKMEVIMRKIVDMDGTEQGQPGEQWGGGRGTRSGCVSRPMKRSGPRGDDDSVEILGKVEGCCGNSVVRAPILPNGGSWCNNSPRTRCNATASLWIGSPRPWG